MKRIKYVVCEHIVAQVFDLLLYYYFTFQLCYDGKMFVLRQKKTSTNYLQQTEVLKVHYVGIPWEEGTSLNAGN